MVATVLQPEGDRNGNQPSDSPPNQNDGAASNDWPWETTFDAINAVSTVAIVALTIALFCVARQEHRLNTTTLRSTQAVERAYLKLSPHEPGIRIGDVILPGPSGEDAQLDVSIYMQLTNVGNTPATITNALMHLFITDTSLPEFPPYDEGLLRPLWVTLVKEQDIRLFHHYPFSVVGLEDIRMGSKRLKLYAIGYVDYIDKFGGRHRSGYARVYNPSDDDFSTYTEGADFDTASKAFRERINLSFVTQPHYSYDRERHQGEGQDWDEPPKQLADNNTGLSYQR